VADGNGKLVSPTDAFYLLMQHCAVLKHLIGQQVAILVPDMFRGMNILQEDRDNGILAKHLFPASHFCYEFFPADLPLRYHHF